jgi:KUP system potassium uptake protein
MLSVLTLVFAFETLAAVAYAFGMAVTGTITIITLLFFYIVWRHWGTPLWLVVAGGAVLLLIDLLFLAANLTKLVHGAWHPLLIAVTRQREAGEGSLREFITELHELRPPLHRVSGTAVFLNRGKQISRHGRALEPDRPTRAASFCQRSSRGSTVWSSRREAMPSFV